MKKVLIAIGIVLGIGASAAAMEKDADKYMDMKSVMLMTRSRLNNIKNDIPTDDIKIKKEFDALFTCIDHDTSKFVNKYILHKECIVLHERVTALEKATGNMAGKMTRSTTTLFDKSDIADDEIMTLTLPKNYLKEETAETPQPESGKDHKDSSSSSDDEDNNNRSGSKTNPDNTDDKKDKLKKTGGLGLCVKLLLAGGGSVAMVAAAAGTAYYFLVYKKQHEENAGISQNEPSGITVEQIASAA